MGDSDVDVAAVVGGVVAGLAVLAFLGVLMHYFMLRRKADASDDMVSDFLSERLFPSTVSLPVWPHGSRSLGLHGQCFFAVIETPLNTFTKYVSRCVYLFVAW